MTAGQLEEERLKNITRLRKHRGALTLEEWEAYKLNNTRSHQKQRLTTSEEERERIRSFDREWHKICRQDCHMEDCCSLDSCDILDEDVEIHCQELKQYVIQIEANGKVYGFEDEDSIFDSDSENEESKPCDVFL